MIKFSSVLLLTATSLTPHVFAHGGQGFESFNEDLADPALREAEEISNRFSTDCTGNACFDAFTDVVFESLKEASVSSGIQIQVKGSYVDMLQALFANDDGVEAPQAAECGVVAAFKNPAPCVAYQLGWKLERAMKKSNTLTAAQSAALKKAIDRIKKNIVDGTRERTTAILTTFSALKKISNSSSLREQELRVKVQAANRTLDQGGKVSNTTIGEITAAYKNLKAKGSISSNTESMLNEMAQSLVTSLKIESLFKVEN